MRVRKARLANCLFIEFEIPIADGDRRRTDYREQPERRISIGWSDIGSNGDRNRIPRLNGNGSTSGGSGARGRCRLNEASSQPASLGPRIARADARQPRSFQPPRARQVQSARKSQSERTMTESVDKVRAPAKSPGRLGLELGAILDKMNELPLSSPARLHRLSRAYARLWKPRLGARLRGCLALLLSVAAACLSLHLARNYCRRVHYEKCLVEQPSLARQIFRPAVDCSICRDVRHIEKVSSVDPSLFEDRYAYSGRPVVVTDAATNWTAMELFSFAFLKDLYQDRTANCQFFPYNTEFHSLRDVFNMSISRALLQIGTQPWYVGWSNCDEVIGTILRKHYQRPYFLPDTAESEKTDWIFMGSPGYGAPMHVDDVQYPSWQAQIRGCKKWILEPPRECYYSCSRLEVTVNPGEIIILDTNKWYHQTLIVSEDISITIGAEYD